ncbi:hypothetical protein C2845_PM18G05940 [Panicum miliaceum]|uniref:F-box domain-containing protein n=1 Tax=Panicum miliaceum TaxID=4540 RepID=A0A3L6PJ75_PANMI|nr:hypothetical protein C2845_PM18G05940 [Panicum miliaceum]
MAPPRQPPELIDDAVAEILLRLPDEPADLFRASLVCKLWLRIASDPAFLRRYRAFHRGAPLLGFFYSVRFPSHSPHFIPTTEASPPLRRPAFDDHDWLVLDCSHGRVLLRNSESDRDVSVRDPITGSREELPPLDIWYTFYKAVVIWSAAITATATEVRSSWSVWGTTTRTGPYARACTHRRPVPGARRILLTLPAGCRGFLHEHKNWCFHIRAEVRAGEEGRRV